VPRSEKLEKEITRLKKEAGFMGFVLDVEKTIDEDSYIISNKKQNRAVVIGRVDENGSNEIHSFIINVYKWRWAEAEGFTRNQMVDKLGAEIFSSIDCKSISSYLAGSGAGEDA